MSTNRHRYWGRGRPLLLACALAGAALTACGGGNGDSLADLIRKPQPLNTTERASLQRLVAERAKDHIYVSTYAASVTTSLDIQYNARGDVQFMRTQDPVRMPDDQTGEIKEGTAVAVFEYTGTPLTSCSGDDLGRERVIRWDTLFGNDYVSLEPKPTDVRPFRIAIDDAATKDLGFDATTGARVFERPLDNISATVSISTEGEPVRSSLSNAPQGFEAMLTPKEPQEQLGPTEGLTPPDCQK